METAYDVKYPKDMMRTSGNEPVNWAESTIHRLSDCLEDYARAQAVVVCDVVVRHRICAGLETEALVSRVRPGGEDRRRLGREETGFQWMRPLHRRGFLACDLAA